MKKLVLFFMGLTVFLSACKKNNDYIFSDSPDTRINAALAKYQSILAGAENGWNARITVDSGKGPTYSLYFKFDTSNRVKMVSDFDTTSVVTLQESSYRLREQQQPTLIFDTYSYVHVLADPNEANDAVVANINGGAVGVGLYSDFEFIIDDSQIKTDTIVMIGKVNNAKLTLIKATKQEADIYTGASWNLVSKYFDKLLTYYKRMSIGGVSYDIRFNTQTRQITFNWLDGTGNLQSHSTGYYNTTSGIVLEDPLQNGSQKIETLSVDSYDAASQTITVKAGGASGTVTETVFPVKIDTAAPANWIQYVIDMYGYWASDNGFHVNGVDDAFKIKSLASYYYLAYWPEYDPGIDLFAPIFLNAAQTGLTLKYGTGVTHSIGTNGVVVFTATVNYGSNPTTGPAKLTRTQMLQPEGYYFVKTGDATYDMVSAKDGKTWLSWYF
jgi:hypothetical protein